MDTPLPSEDLILDWIAHLAFVRRLKASTIKGKLGHINGKHFTAGKGAPLDGFKRVRMAIDTLKKASGAPNRKHPAGPPILEECQLVGLSKMATECGIETLPKGRKENQFRVRRSLCRPTQAASRCSADFHLSAVRSSCSELSQRDGLTPLFPPWTNRPAAPCGEEGYYYHSLFHHFLRVLHKHHVCLDCGEERRGRPE